MRETDASVIVNSLYNEITGNSDISTVDSTNIIDIGTTLQGLTTADNIYGKFCDKVGMFIIKNRLMKLKFPNVFKDSWLYGSILEELRVKPFTAIADPSRNPSAGTYDSFTKYAPADVVAKYYNSEDTFQFKYWRPTDQLWSSFNNLNDMTKFLTAIEISIINSLNVRILSLTQTALNTMAAHTIYKDYPTAAYGDSSHSRAVNVLKEYNETLPSTATPLTVATYKSSPEFWKFFVKKVMLDRDRMQILSKIYNIDGEDAFSNEEDIQLTVLSHVDATIKVDMQSDTYNYNLVKLPGNYTTIAALQGIGDDVFSEDVASEIQVKIKIDDSTQETIDMSNILAYQYDKNAVMITCENQKVNTFQHPDLDQTCFYHKFRAGYACDFSENFIVYFVADPS